MLSLNNNLNIFIIKKIKSLHRFLITLIVLNTLFFVAKIYNILVFEGEFEFSEIVLNISISLIVIAGLCFLQSALFSIIKKGFFNNNAYNNFKNSGIFFLVAGSGGAIIDIVMIIRTSDNIFELLYSNLGSDFLLIMIGFSLFTLADLVQNGNFIKTENDLTI